MNLFWLCLAFDQKVLRDLEARGDCPLPVIIQPRLIVIIVCMWNSSFTKIGDGTTDAYRSCLQLEASLGVTHKYCTTTLSVERLFESYNSNDFLQSLECELLHDRQFTTVG